MAEGAINIGRGRIAQPRQPQTLPDTGAAAEAEAGARQAGQVATAFLRLAAAAGDAQQRVAAEAEQAAQKQNRLKTNNQVREFAALGQGFEKVSVLEFSIMPDDTFRDAGGPQSAIQEVLASNAKRFDEALSARDLTEDAQVTTSGLRDAFNATLSARLLVMADERNRLVLRGDMVEQIDDSVSQVRDPSDVPVVMAFADSVINDPEAPENLFTDRQKSKFLKDTRKSAWANAANSALSTFKTRVPFSRQLLRGDFDRSMDGEQLLEIKVIANEVIARHYGGVFGKDRIDQITEIGEAQATGDSGVDTGSALLSLETLARKFVDERDVMNEVASPETIEGWQSRVRDSAMSLLQTESAADRGWSYLNVGGLQGGGPTDTSANDDQDLAIKRWVLPFLNRRFVPPPLDEVGPPTPERLAASDPAFLRRSKARMVSRIIRETRRTPIDITNWLTGLSSGDTEDILMATAVITEIREFDERLLSRATEQSVERQHRHGIAVQKMTAALSPELVGLANYVDVLVRSGEQPARAVNLAIDAAAGEKGPLDAQKINAAWLAGGYDAKVEESMAGMGAHSRFPLEMIDDAKTLAHAYFHDRSLGANGTIEAVTGAMRASLRRSWQISKVGAMSSSGVTGDASVGVWMRNSPEQVYGGDFIAGQADAGVAHHWIQRQLRDDLRTLFPVGDPDPAAREGQQVKLTRESFNTLLTSLQPQAIASNREDGRPRYVFYIREGTTQRVTGRILSLPGQPGLPVIFTPKWTESGTHRELETQGRSATLDRSRETFWGLMQKFMFGKPDSYYIQRGLTPPERGAPVDPRPAFERMDMFEALNYLNRGDADAKQDYLDEKRDTSAVWQADSSEQLAALAADPTTGGSFRLLHQSLENTSQAESPRALSLIRSFTENIGAILQSKNFPAKGVRDTTRIAADADELYVDDDTSLELLDMFFASRAPQGPGIPTETFNMVLQLLQGLPPDGLAQPLAPDETTANANT